MSYRTLALTALAAFAFAATATDVMATRIKGAVAIEAVALPGESLNYFESFRPGERAVIQVSGNGKGSLDLFVFDPSGRMIARDTRPGDTCTVHFVSHTRAAYRILVQNTGLLLEKFTMRIP